MSRSTLETLLPRLTKERAEELAPKLYLATAWQQVDVVFPPFHVSPAEVDGVETPPETEQHRARHIKFGPIAGIPVGSWFVNRKALQAAGVHRPGQAGICGSERLGVESIVVSGGYPEDEDYGDSMIYTGHGGYNTSGGPQVRDQTLTRGNAALVTSYVNETPIRVIRGAGGDPAYSPDQGFRYDGLFGVEDFWSEPGRAGFLVWRYLLQRLPELDAELDSNQSLALSSAAQADQPAGNGAPARRGTVTQRVVRSTAVAEWVKKAYGHACQICGDVLSLPRGTYAEGAHIQPLGKPHNGPDVVGNILCLCPNHHVMFDAGAIWLTNDLEVIDHLAGSLGHLQITQDHQIGRDRVTHHRVHIAKQQS